MNGFPNNLNSFAKDLTLGFKELPNISLSRLRKVFSLMGKKEKITLTVLIAVAFISLLTSLNNFYLSHTVPVPSEGGVYTEGAVGQPTYINPILANTEPDLSLTNLVFSGLYKYDQDGHLQPDLADGMPTISADQKQYTVNLKHSAKWHNGKPLTADDVIFTVQTLPDPNFKSPLRMAWQSATVQKLSDYTVQFTTKDVSGMFVQKLTLGILPKGIWGNIDAQNFLLSKYNLEAVGSGPYTIKGINKLPNGKVEQVSFAAFQNYYSGRPKIDQINFKFYDSETDLPNAFHSREIMGFGFTPLTSAINLDAAIPSAQTLAVPLPQYQVIFFNLNNPLLSDLNVRQAIALATDSGQVNSQIFKGNSLLPVSPFLFSNSATRQTMPSTLDIAQAKSLLDKSGWIADPTTGLRSKKNQSLSLNLATSDWLINAKTAQLLADQWRQIGIKINLNILPIQQLNDTLIKPRAFDILLFPQKFSSKPDPFHFWHSSQAKDPGVNLTGFADPTVDQLIIDARTTTDQAKTSADYEKLSQIILAKTPVIYLDQAEYLYTLDESVKNIKLNTLYDSSQRFNNVEDWYINTKRVWK